MEFNAIARGGGAGAAERARFERTAGSITGRADEGGGGFAARLRERLPAAAPDAADGGAAKIDKKLYEQCEALEMYFLKTLVSSMRKTVDKAELNKGGFAGEMYEDMLWDEYAKDFSKNARFGFARLAYLELTGQRSGNAAPL
jgi:flagellar protein FlgJ